VKLTVTSARALACGLSALAATVFALLPEAASAQQANWPTKRVTFIVPSAPAGTTDIVARMLAEPLSKVIGRPVVVENRAGASGNIGAEVTLQAAADGHTILIQYSGYHVGNPNLYKNLRWNPSKDFTGVAMLLRAPHVIAVSGKLPVNSLRELIAYGRAKPLFYGSSGVGSIQHIAGALFGERTAVPVTHVPYKGAGVVLPDLVNGQLAMFITTPPSLMGYAASGKVRLLAYAAPERHLSLPNVPTAAEAGLPGYEVESWFAAFAPAATPKPVVEKISAAMKQVVESAAYRKRAEEQGAFANYMTPAALNGFVTEELNTWANVIAAAKITLE
jgi:tripartite-type tricarboxylate transporter receptor subunit TctC